MHNWYSKLLVNACLLLWCGTSGADCWELTDGAGEKLTVSDIWHVRSRFGETGGLLGRLDGENTSIPVVEISQVILEPARQGWLPIPGSGSARGRVIFTDGRTGRFEVDLPLHYSSESAKHSMPIAEVRSVVRCDPATAESLRSREAAPEQPAAGGPLAATHEADSVQLSNGDVLSGEITTPEFQWLTPYGPLVFAREQVNEINLAGSGEWGSLVLKSGDRISGNLGNPSVEIRLVYGQRVPLDGKLITVIRIR